MSWPVVAITKVARVVGGATPKSDNPDFWGGNIEWATPKDLSDLSEKCLSATPRKITDAGLKSCAAEVLPAGSVLFSSRAPIGHIAINTVPMATNQGFKSFIPGPELDASFLYWWLNANRARLQAMGTGATFKEVSKAAVERIEIPLPPLPEQKRIAGILDQADALRRLRARALDKLNTLGQAIFHEMFGDPSKKWPEVSVSAITKDARTGPFGSQLLVSEFTEAGIPVLGIDNVVQNRFVWAKERFISAEKYKKLKRYQVRPGDVLITIMGTCGRCAVAPETIGQAINTKHICCLTPVDGLVRSVFLQSSLIWDNQVLLQLGVESKGAIMPGLNMRKILDLKMRLPPIEQQMLFEERIRHVADHTRELQGALITTDSLFTALQHRAFRGDL